MSVYVCEHGRAPRIKEGPVLIWSSVSDLCPLIHGEGMLFVLQSAAVSRRGERAARSTAAPLTQKCNPVKCLRDLLRKLLTPVIVRHLRSNI